MRGARSGFYVFLNPLNTFIHAVATVLEIHPMNKKLVYLSGFSNLLLEEYLFILYTNFWFHIFSCVRTPSLSSQNSGEKYKSTVETVF